MIHINRVVLAGAILGLAAIGCSDETFPTLSLSTPKETFSAQLTGAAERPTPVTTTSSGSATAVFQDSVRIRYEVLIDKIDAVTAAHFHAGTAADAGPVMFTIFSPAAPTAAGLSGVLRQADIVKGGAGFSAPFTFDSLATRLRAGTAYVNVHTTANPGGQIRGQLAKQ